nr:MAG TPA: hypothetical protein [Caudoviricetes sp.]
MIRMWLSSTNFFCYINYITRHHFNNRKNTVLFLLDNRKYL